ncbi:HIRAN domain-containing protein [Microbacterium sp. NPDC091313]
MMRFWEELLHAVTGRPSRHRNLPDLRHLASRRVAVDGTHYLVDDCERQHQDERLYVLRRAPRDRRSATSIAVFANGRSVGHLPPRITASVAPLLDELGGAAVVNVAGAMSGSIRLRVDVPTVDALVDYVRAEAE